MPPLSGSGAAAEPLPLVVSGVHKSYGSNDVLRGVDLSVERGEILALIGANGSGKTTLLDLVNGLTRPESGAIRVFGADPGIGIRHRLRVGVLLQTPSLDPLLRVREFLSYCAQLYSSRRPSDALLELVGLAHKADVRCNRLSVGEARLVELAAALLGNPDLLVLDEPTSAIDPVNRSLIWSELTRLADAGAAVIVTTHLMREVESFASRAAILRDGRINFVGTPTEIALRSRQATEIRFFIEPGEVHGTPPPGAVGQRDGSFCIALEGPADEAIKELYLWAERSDVNIAGLSIARRDFESAVVQLAQADEGA